MQKTGKDKSNYQYEFNFHRMVLKWLNKPKLSFELRYVLLHEDK
jgi:hypothetical protein